jgi:outer membrane receptor protein involved in Fe transport
MSNLRILRGRPLGVSLALTAIGALSILSATARADNASSSPESLQEVVIQTTPLPGPGVDLDEVPGNVQVISATDISRQGTASLTSALDTGLSSININDDLDDPFQPDILYRGFEASPVLGTPQGLAVYQNGVRINEAFGNTVNWDMIPPNAIDKVEIVSSSAVYGLNALGGAISVDMKNGFNSQGADLEASGGSFDQQNITAEAGGHSGALGFYVAARALDWRGWRFMSSDRLRDVYAALSLHTDAANFDLTYTRAQNTLNGQGPAPVQELDYLRSLAFTGPQTNVNDLNFVTLNGTVPLPENWSMQTALYYRQYGQSVLNGNTTDYGPCADTPGILCQPDGSTPLTNAAGQNLADISDGGTYYIGENDFELVNAWGRGATLQASNNAALFGHPNSFTAGAAVDYASTSFYTGAQIGLVTSNLAVEPSDIIVYTPENSQAANDNGDPVPISVDSVNKTFGGYVTDTFQATRALAITAGGRYNIANIDLVDQLGSNLTGWSRFVHFNPSIGATYKLLPSMTLYGGYSINTRTPTASEIECSNPLTPCLLPTDLAGDPPTLKQVVAHTIEIGLRGRVPGVTGDPEQLAWNASVFRTVLEDDIYGIATSVSQGFFQNIGDTRREGVEVDLDYHAQRWSSHFNYSLVKAQFLSAMTLPSPSNPYQDENGDIAVQPGDTLPGIPKNRVKAGADFQVLPQWTLGASVEWVGSVYYVGDEANLTPPIPSYTVVDLNTTYTPFQHLQIFASIDNLLNRKYGTWGILSDPTGTGAPGVPVNGYTNGPGVDNRFLSPAAPLEVFGGMRIQF